MNEQSMIETGENAGKKFNEFNGVLGAIERSLLTAQDHLKRHDDAIYEALGTALDLGHMFATKREKEQDWDWSFLKDFVTFHNSPWTAKCETNMFHALVTVGFDKVDDVTGKPLCSAPQLSKYRTVLRYAFEAGMNGADLVRKLSQTSLSEIYEQAVSVFRFDPLDHFIEDDAQRYTRASKMLLEAADLPTGTFTEGFPKPEKQDGFLPAMIHVDEDGFKLVGVFDKEPADDVIHKVSSLVPAEAKRSRHKLAEQPGYPLFVACDLFTRFLPRIADVAEWQKAAKAAASPVLTHESSNEDVAALLAWMRNGSAGNKVDQPSESDLGDAMISKDVGQKFKLLDALRFVHDKSGWVASNITSLPHAPCCEVRFPEHRLTSRIAPMAMTSLEASRLVSRFPRHSPWKLHRANGGLVLRSQSDTSISLAATNLDDLVNWRSLDPDLKPVARFELSKDTLDKLDTWEAEFRDSVGHGRIQFQRYQSLEVVEDRLHLVLPDRDGHRRTFGMLTSEDTPAWTAPRFFDFKLVRHLIQFALDYGISYEFDLLKGYQGISAARFSLLGLPFDASVTLPLMLSQKGNPVEITLPQHTDPAPPTEPVSSSDR